MVLNLLWPPDAKNWLIWKDPNAGKDWGQEEKRTIEDQMVGWHHQLNGHKLRELVMDREAWHATVHGVTESVITERLNWIELNNLLYGPTLISVCDYWEKHNFDYMIVNLVDKWLIIFNYWILNECLGDQWTVKNIAPRVRKKLLHIDNGSRMSGSEINEAWESRDKPCQFISLFHCSEGCLPRPDGLTTWFPHLYNRDNNISHQDGLSSVQHITNSRSPPKPMSVELVMPSNHLILCRPCLLLPSIFPRWSQLGLNKF